MTKRKRTIGRAPLVEGKRVQLGETLGFKSDIEQEAEILSYPSRVHPPISEAEGSRYHADYSPDDEALIHSSSCWRE